MRKKLTALLLACLLLVCLVLPVSAADVPALFGTANAADGTVTVTLSLRGGSAVRSGAFTLSYDSSLTLSKTEKGLPLAVANTKAYSTQLAVLYLIAIYMAEKLGMVTSGEYAAFVKDIEALPDMVAEVLKNKEQVQYLASKFYNCHSIFFIGRNLDYAVSLEGSLKLKEISYIHSEAYAAGELKHGTISLIEDGTLVVALATGRDLFDKTISNVKEVKARGAVVMGVTTTEHDKMGEVADYVIRIPTANESILPSLSVIPLQLFGYYVASLKGCDIDKPRNLAKSVTVE